MIFAESHFISWYRQ